MPSGQVQSVYKSEKALEPESIRDVQNILAGRVPGIRVTKHKTISGLMFIEVDLITKKGPVSSCLLVLGEDPHEPGCIVTSRLWTDDVTGIRAGVAYTSHGSHLDDTRGGIPNTAWCTSFQFKRGLTQGGGISRSYWSMLPSRAIFCRQLLEVFKEPGSFNDQNWQKIQNVIDGYQDFFHRNGVPRVPEGFLFLRNDNIRLHIANNQAQNQEPEPERELEPEPESESDTDDFGNDFQLPVVPRFVPPRSIPEDEDDPFGLDQDLGDIEDLTTTDDGDVTVGQDDDNGRSPSPLFEPRSRSVPPKPTTTTNTQLGYDDEENDINIDRPTTLNSRLPSESGDTSPGPRTMTTADPNKPGSKTNPFDITNVSDVDGDDDDMIILYHEIKADPTEGSDLTGGGLGVNQVKREIIEFDSDTIGDGSSVIQTTPDAAEDDPDFIMGEHVRLVIDIDD
ncbi:hypothetical protein D6C91_03930 [Aureobasidium pullulans]|uniref:Uncharacterized protein n=1 Tax=Aureobasidium pullulans TaxID=5580 RepID=A0A4V6THL8_AURPU|nr:hypothetical protein D6C91_03930 [Aureobasidium pullulans]